MCTENYVTQEHPSEISRPQQLMQPAVTLDPEGKALNRRYRSCRAGISRPCTSGKGQWILCEGTVRALHSFSGFCNCFSLGATSNSAQSLLLVLALASSFLVDSGNHIWCRRSDTIWLWVNPAHCTISPPAIFMQITLSSKVPPHLSVILTEIYNLSFGQVHMYLSSNRLEMTWGSSDSWGKARLRLSTCGGPKA